MSSGHVELGALSPKPFCSTESWVVEVLDLEDLLLVPLGETSLCVGLGAMDCKNGGRFADPPPTLPATLVGSEEAPNPD